MNARTVSLVIILALVAVGLVVAQTKKALTNDDILQMAKAGFQESMIIKTIEANDTNFDVSVQALGDLRPRLRQGGRMVRGPARRLTAEVP